jgi:hypothetical protein
VLRHCGVVMRSGIAQMRCDAFTAMEQLHSRSCDARVNLLAEQIVRNTVVVFIELDVVIYVDATVLPLGVLVRCIR